MKKVLIWNTYEIRPTGGPSGYLFNIKEYVSKNKIDNIVFLSDVLELRDLNLSKYDFIFLKVLKKLFSLSKIKKSKILNLEIFIKYVLSKKDYKKINLYINNFDYIHFHTTYELTKYLDFLREKKFKGKIILTTHTPKPTYLEIIEDWNQLKIDDIPPKIFNLLKRIDSTAFNEADILLYPSRFALEPYRCWDYFNKIEAKKNFKFIPTGININKVIVRESRDSILNKYNIPKGSFIISYIGRYNKTKGFDILKKFAEIILKKYDNVYFLIAGKEIPLKGLNHNRWIEIGWTNDPYSIINANDLFILPNRETFFDLVLLEAMTLNKPVLLSKTGGNKYFMDKGLDLYYFESTNVDSMVSVFENTIYNKRFNNNVNRNYIINNLQISHYIDKYLELLDND
jgi:glycosyltransferase involved in cell wall biosynthesis